MTKTTGGENMQFATESANTSRTISPNINTRNNLNVTRTYSNNGIPTHNNNNDNKITHCRTHSHPLTLELHGGSSSTTSQLPVPASSSLTEILNLDFVNIPPVLTNEQLERCDPDSVTFTLQIGGSGRTPGEIPPSVMQKYLTTSEHSSPSSNNNNNNIEEILVDLDAVQSTSEIAKVLDNFNAILERIEGEDETINSNSTNKLISNSTPSSCSSSSSNRIKNSVEAFADLLLSGHSHGGGEEQEDQDLLIIVDESLQEENQGQSQGQRSIDEYEDELERDEIGDLCPSLLELGDELEDYEGYESDRPMVRASMRKLRPVKLRPLPPSNSNEGQGQVPSSPVTPTSNDNGNNTIYVTSLVNCVLNTSNSSSDSPPLVIENEGGSVSVSVVEGQGPGSSSPQHSESNANQSTSSSSLRNIIVINETIPPSTNQLNLPSNNNTTSGNIIISTVSSNTENTSIPVSTSTASTSESSRITPTSNGTTTSGTTTSGTTNVRRARGGQNGTNNSRGAGAGRWPHRLSSVLALIGCTLGLNNICRFALLSVQYGANFILQFVFLSIVFGIPLLTFHMSIGQYLSAGIIDMWKISPIFQGIGVGIMISQAIIGLYTAVGVSWMFIYFRDSFVTRHDQYRWGKCVREFRDCEPYPTSTVYGYNQTIELAQTVPDYFNGVVLQKSSPEYPTSAYVPSSLKFTVAFNLAVVWMLVFVSLSKGLKSYGKVVHGFVLAPVAALFVLAFKMVGLVESSTLLFGQTNWSEFFFNSQTWVVAARESFFTWGLLGACVMQVTAHNRHSHPLKSDAVIVIMVTTVVLLLSAFIGNTCLSVITSSIPNALQSQQYSYVPSSFESQETYKFLAMKEHELPELMSYNYNHNPLLMGVRITKPDMKQDHKRSGYQVLRLATELFPTTMAILSPSGLSPFWTVLFYFTLVLFGIAQQLAIWHCVIKGIIAIKAKVLRSWETTITFFVCGLGFVLGLPLCTETGIFVNYFLDFTIGSGWWIMILYLLELVAVFIVRGAPYCGENIVTVLITGAGRLALIAAPLVSFVWNVIMPVALLVLAIGSFKSGNVRELYDWNPHRGYTFWPSWTREIGSLIQLLPILAVPFVAIVQSCRYLSNGPADLFDRMQQLYRPSTRFGNIGVGRTLSESSTRNGGNSGRTSEDPPPKYTPPPSYSTATGAKIARFLRNSFRRSLRRISSPGGVQSTSSLPPPPNYASVILEINSQRGNESTSRNLQREENGSQPPPQYEEATSQQQHQTEVMKLENSLINKYNCNTKVVQSQTLGRSLGEGSKERGSLRRIASDITSRDIARMLRASMRRQNQNPNEFPYNLDNSGGGITFIANNPSASNDEEAGPSSFRDLPPYSFSRNSLEKIDYDLNMLTELELEGGTSQTFTQQLSEMGGGTFQSFSQEPSTSSTNRLHTSGYDYERSRNRNSNDSQLALISNGCYDLSTVVDFQNVEINNLSAPISPHYHQNSNLLTLGIVNPTFTLHGGNETNSLPSYSEA